MQISMHLKESVETLSLLVTCVMMSSALSSGLPKDPIAITHLPDGVTVSYGESLRHVTATWNIFITIEQPQRPSELVTQIGALDTTFAELDQLNKQGLIIDLKTQRSKQQHLKNLLKINPNTRLRRGLLDIGGSILNKLFGVATSSDISRLTDAMNSMISNNKEVVHSINHLATVVNQTRRYVRALASTQQTIEHHLSRLNRATEKIARVVDIDQKRLTALEVTTELDRYIDVLTIAADQYRRHMDVFMQQQTDLGLGKLTRHLISEKLLSEVLEQASADHHVVSRLSWYFMHLSVKQIRYDNKFQAIYMVEIPLITTTPYIMYHINAFANPINASALVVRLVINEIYACDTTSNFMFSPQFCVGQSPTVCVSGPLFNSEGLSCARALITGDHKQIKTCKVRLERTSGKTQIEMITPNQYAITSWSEDITVRCPGERQRKYSLSLGLYNITCLRPCQIEGATWSITCIDHIHVAQTYNMSPLTITNLVNFSARADITQLELALPDVNNPAGMSSLETDVTYILNQHQVSPFKVSTSWANIWINSALIACLWILLAFICIKGKFIMSKIKRTIKGHLPVSTDDNINNIDPPVIYGPLAIDAGRQPRVPQIDNQPAIWPILPSFAQCMSQS